MCDAGLGCDTYLMLSCVCDASHDAGDAADNEWKDLEPDVGLARDGDQHPGLQRGSAAHCPRQEHQAQAVSW